MRHGPRDDYPGSIQHVWSRGSDRRRIVLDTIDRTRWVDRLDTTAARFDLSLLAWTLLTNHFHFVVRVGELGLSRPMQWLNGGYSRMFNIRHGCDAHLFRNRFSSRLLESDEELLSVCRYVERNAMHAGVCLSPEEYRWSSYRAIVGLDPPPSSLARIELLAHFGRPLDAAVRRYRAFVLGPD